MIRLFFWLKTEFALLSFLNEHTHSHLLGNLFNVSVIGESVFPIVDLFLSSHERRLIRFNITFSRRLFGVSGVWTRIRETRGCPQTFNVGLHLLQTLLNSIYIRKWKDYTWMVWKSIPFRWDFPVSLGKVCCKNSSPVTRKKEPFIKSKITLLWIF